MVEDWVTNWETEMKWKSHMEITLQTLCFASVGVWTCMETCDQN